MGWFGPTVKERSKYGRIEFYGKCDECGKEQSGDNKSKVTRALESCEKADKRAKEDKKNKEIKDAAEAARNKKEAKERAEREEREEQAKALKRKLQKKAREKRREAKGKVCAFCGKSPCAGTKPKCAMVIADQYESASNIDVSDPATFYDWARDWKNR